MMIGSALAASGWLLQAAQPAAPPGPATLADVYGWVYRTGKEVPIDVPAAACLGLKTPQKIYERTWLAPDGRIHAIEAGEDKANPFVLLSVRHSLDEDYAGKFWLAGANGGLLGACDSPFMYASFARVNDGSLDAEFRSEKMYFLDKFGQRWKWDRYAPVKRDYP